MTTKHSTFHTITEEKKKESKRRTLNAQEKLQALERAAEMDKRFDALSDVMEDATGAETICVTSFVLIHLANAMMESLEGPCTHARHEHCSKWDAAHGIAEAMMAALSPDKALAVAAMLLLELTKGSIDQKDVSIEAASVSAFYEKLWGDHGGSHH